MKVGTVGTNFIVDRFIEGALKTGRVSLAAVYSRNEQTARAFAEKHGISGIFTNREEFLRNPEIDFVYVAAPNSLHYRWSLDALNAGKNVICEKPFVSKTAELERLAALAREKKLFLFEALTTPHLPNFRLIREKLPLIGKVRYVQLNFSQYSSRYPAFVEGKNPNVFNPDFSGGALMDLNYYNLCFIQRLFGEPEEIRYFADLAGNGIDLSGVLIMKYGGFIASASAVKNSDGRNSVQIQGETGYLITESQASHLRGGFSLVTKNGTEHFDGQDCENALYYELEHFAAAYEAGDRLDSELEESLCAARLMDRARKDAGIVFPADKNP